jgi:ribose 5-phosphate isomerase B
MKIFIGADHNGFAVKNDLIKYLSDHGHDIVDKGDQVLDPGDDYPIFAQKVVDAVLASSSDDTRGILLCGSGQGMVIAANRYKGIRAGVVWDNEEAKMVRNDDDSNVLCIPTRIMDLKQIKLVTDTWLNTPFAGAVRYTRRIKELDKLG